MLIASEHLIAAADCATPLQALELLSGLLQNNDCTGASCAAALEAGDRAFPCVLNGIAVSHLGTADEGLLRRGGVAALRLNRPLDWYGSPVSLVFAVALPRPLQPAAFAAIAALSADAERLAAVAEAALPSDLLTLFNAVSVAASRAAIPAPPPERRYEATLAVFLKDPNGIHARPAAKLAAAAAGFDGELLLLYRDQAANLRSAGAVMGLGIGEPAEVTVAANGAGAAEAVKRIAGMIENGLDDAAAAENEALNFAALPTFPPSRQAIHGIPASPGIGIAPLFRLDMNDRRPAVPEQGSSPAKETARLRQGWHAAAEALQRLSAGLIQQGEKTSAGVFEAHRALLADEALQQRALQLIADGKSAPFAWQTACAQAAETIANSESQRIAERAIDYQDVAKRVLAFLLPETAAATRWPSGRFILAAVDLTPSQTAQLPRAQVAGIVTVQGGPTAHTAILARALGIPAVVAAGDAVLQLPEAAAPMILNGVSGFLEPQPDATQLAAAEKAAAELAGRQSKLERLRFEAARTVDGIGVEIAANITSAAEARQAVEAGADGIGLLRTEILVQDCREAPQEETLLAGFAEIAAALDGRPILIRTYDIGGDKPVPFMPVQPEANPFLGVRGIRLCFAYPAIFRTQLRAILRAIRDHHLNGKIMLPMIAAVDELRRGKQFIQQEAAALQMSCPPIGIMIEVPSAVWMIDALAQESDFFSIGTNDLTQYILAMDRLHPVLASQADSLDPAVLRAIAAAVDGARRQRKWIGVCGNLASDPIGAAVLLGLGVDELSMGAPAIAGVKALVRGSRLEALKSRAQRALQCVSAAEVRALYS